MAYLVLARKYRPQTFTEVCGQEHVTRTLANAFEKDRVHHGFLFCGPRGVGKTTLARILGKALNCVNGPTAEPCGQCEACVSISEGRAVDYHEMDGASNRGIDAIRELTEAVRYQPAALRKKVYVIDEVHMLTTEAFNALLKTLEEPPPHVTFVLATTEPHKVPVTILSRCQRYDFKLVAASRLAEHLRNIFERESIAIEPGAIALVVRESGGSVRDALSLCDQIISYVGEGEAVTEAVVADVLGVADRALTRGLIEAVVGGDARAALETVDQAVGRGVDEIQLTRALTRALHDIAVAQSGQGAEALVGASDGEKADLVAQASAIEPSRIRLMCERMLKASTDLADSPEPRIVLDLALIDLSVIEPLPPVSVLIDRLARLEARLAGGAAPPTSASPNRTSPRSSGSPPKPVSASPKPVSAAGSGPTADPPPPNPPPLEGEGDSIPRVTESERIPRVTESERIPRVTESERIPQVTESERIPRVTESERIPRVTNPPPLEGEGEGRGRASPPAPRDEPRPTMNGAPADPLQAWADVLTALDEARQMALLSWYEHAMVLAWTESKVELGFAEGVVADMAMDTDNVTAMRSFLQKRAGRPIELDVRILKDSDKDQVASARSVLQARAEDAEAERQSRAEEARAHPLTQSVLSTFGATIQEIKTDV